MTTPHALRLDGELTIYRAQELRQTLLQRSPDLAQARAQLTQAEHQLDLQRRMRTMHGLYYQATGSMTLEHVNHFEREGVLPIAFSLFHYTNMEDASFMLISGMAPIWNEEWQERVQMTVNDHGKHRTVHEMESQRIGDYGAFVEYMEAVFGRTESWLDALDPADLDESEPSLMLYTSGTTGRPKGVRNKLTNLRDAVLEAFDTVGGADYLVRLANGGCIDRSTNTNPGPAVCAALSNVNGATPNAAALAVLPPGMNVNGFVWVLPPWTFDCVPVKRTFSPLAGSLMPISSRTFLKICATRLILRVSESRIVSMASSWPCSAQIAIVDCVRGLFLNDWLCVKGNTYSS